MKKALLLLSFITTCTYAQYVYKPLDPSILQQALEKRNRAEQEANEQYSKLLLKLAEYGSRLNNDDETLLWFDDYKKEIDRSYISYLRSFGPFDARNYAIRKQGEIANDPELMARIRTANEYRATMQSIQQSDMSQQEKTDWVAEHPYCFIPIVNSEGKIIGGKLGTKAELEAYKAELLRKARLLEEQNRARLYAMAHPFDNFDYSCYDKVIDFPQYKRHGTSNKFIISRIALSSTETRVEFEFTNNYADWFNVERETYIKGSGVNKLSFIRAENIAIAPSKSIFKTNGEILKFALIFPAIPKKTKSILIAEPKKNGWKFKDIKIQ